MSSVTVLERLSLFRNLCWTKGHYLFGRYKAVLAISNLDLEGGHMEHPGKISSVAGDSKRLLDMTAFKPTPKQIWFWVRSGFVGVLFSWFVGFFVTICITGVAALTWGNSHWRRMACLKTCHTHLIVLQQIKKEEGKEGFHWKSNNNRCCINSAFTQ